MDLETFLVSLYVLVDDWWQAGHPPTARKSGRPPRLTGSEVLTLAVLAQWPRFRSERDFWRFAQAHLRSYFPTLCSQSQFNRRVRSLTPELRAFQHDLARTLAKSSEAYRVLDPTLIPAIVRARDCRKGLFAGQASFGRNVSKIEWVYGFKVALVVYPDGIVSAFGLAPANCDERPIGDALIAQDRHGAYLADKGFSSVEWERHWLQTYGTLVAATPKNSDRRAWPRVARRWAFGKATDHRGSHRPAQRSLRSRTPSGEDLERTVDPLNGQDRSLHLWTMPQRAAREAAAPLGRSSHLNNCTSGV